MAFEVTKSCAACGGTAVFGIPDEGTIWDHGLLPCYTCAAIHYVCSPCLGHLSLADTSHRRLPCFKSDEFQVVAVLMREVG